MEQIERFHPISEENFRDEYDPQESYPPGVIVRHEGSAYRSAAAIEVGVAPPSEPWRLLVEKGDKGPPGNVASDDPRLSDARDPKPHGNSHAVDGDDPIQPESIGAQPEGDYATNTALSDLQTALQQYADAAAAGVVDSSPETLDTLRELATALGDDPNFATTVSQQIGERARKTETPAGDPSGGQPGWVWTVDQSTGLGAYMPLPDSVSSWDDLEDKPETFPPDPSSTAYDSRYAYADAPALNVTPDGGRFAGRRNPLSLQLGSAGFVASELLAANAANSVSVGSGGKFTHNNSTFGGPGAALSQPIIDLLAAMGRTGVAARYGSEFFAAEYTVGTGGSSSSTTFNDGVLRYLATGNGAKGIFGVGDLSTVMLWCRCVSGSIVFQNRSLGGLGGVVEQRENGTLITGQASNGGLPLAPSDGWVHVYVLARTFAGYDSNHPYIYAAPNSVFQIACPVFYAGRQSPKIHTKPELTINELSA